MSHNEPAWDALIRDCFEHPQDEKRLTRFFQAILPYLRAALLSIYSGDVSAVEDALQTACLKYLAIFRDNRASSVRIGYFFIVGRNCLMDELRRRKGYLPLDEVAESDLPTTATSGESDVRMLLLQHAMMQLDSRCQFILQSYYINEVEAPKLASILGISPDSVHMAIKRCRDRLRAVFLESAAPVSQSLPSRPSKS